MLSRRAMLKSAAALGAVGLSSPLYIKRALSSSGELNLLMWSDEFPDPSSRTSPRPPASW